MGKLTIFALLALMNYVRREKSVHDYLFYSRGEENTITELEILDQEDMSYVADYQLNKGKTSCKVTSALMQMRPL